jgi:hypothetical protein
MPIIQGNLALEACMNLGPLRRRSQEWGWNDPEPESPEIDIEQPYYVNEETAAAAVYLIDDPTFAKKTNKWIQDRFRKTRNPDLIQQELSNNFMNELINGVNKLPSPYKDLAAVSLEKIDWGMLTEPYMSQISGPQFWDKEEEFEELEKAIQMFPEGEDIPLLPESEYDLIEETPSPGPRKHPLPKTRNTWDTYLPEGVTYNYKY